MTGGRNIFLFIVWEKARKHEDEIRAALAKDFQILLETEMFWPYRDFTRKLREFYGFGSRFTWWNKARKCGRGPFKVFLVEDTSPEFKHEKDTRGQELLVDNRVYQDKKAFRLLTTHSNLVHSSVTAKETEDQVKVLFGCGSDELLSLSSCELKLLGMGSRRVCYEIPGSDLCLKCYRDEAQTTGAVAREIRKFRHDERRNTCCQEYRYYQDLKRRLPDYIFAAFPERLEQIYLPSRGWCLLESRVRNADGTLCERFSRTYRAADKATQAKLLKEFWLLTGAFAAYGVRFYDPQNIIVQHLADESFRLRVVDFEPSARTFVPIDSVCPTLCRRKVIRRAERYLKVHFKVEMRYNGLKPYLRRKWDKVIATEGVKAGLINCRAFLENKGVNDIFYQGRFKNRPCIVKCSHVAPWSIGNEYRLLQRLWQMAPEVFVEPLACYEGAFSVLVEEKLPGPTLTEIFEGQSIDSGQIDVFATDLANIAAVLHKANIVHRDLHKSDNFILGDDGHLKVIDCQFSVDRQVGCQDPWLKMNPKYHFCIFSGYLRNGTCFWNDGASILYQLSHFQDTSTVCQVRSRVKDLSHKMTFRQVLTFNDIIALLIYKLSLRLQYSFAKSKHKKESSRYRLSRLSALIKSKEVSLSRPCEMTAI